MSVCVEGGGTTQITKQFLGRLSFSFLKLPLKLMKEKPAAHTAVTEDVN